MRLCATLFLLFALTIVADARERGGLPPAGRTSIVGRVSRGPSTVILRVLEEGAELFPELLTETEVGPGPFRLVVPAPERFFRLVATADGGLLSGDGFRPPNSGYRVSDPMREIEIATMTVRVEDDLGHRIAGARVVRRMGLPGWAGSAAISFLTREFVTDATGSARIPVPVGTRGSLTAWSGGRRSGHWAFGSPTPASLRLLIPRRTTLDLAVAHTRTREGLTSDARKITVRARVGDDWRPLRGAATNEIDWVGMLPAGATAVRVSQAGFGVQEIRDDRLTETARTHIRVLLPEPDETELVVRAGVPDGHTPVRVPGRRCGTGPAPPPVVHEEWRPAGTGKWISAKPPSHGLGCCVGSPRRFRAGRYQIRARGYLLVPVVREVDVQEGISLVVRLHPEPGGAIRLVARGRSGRPAETVSFSVLDEAGREVDIEYTEASARSPAWRFEGKRVDDAPNGGYIVLPPGRYVVALRSGGGRGTRHAVRVYSGIITRLEVPAEPASRHGSDRLR